MWGEYGKATRDYHTFTMLHSIAQILVAANSKKHKQKKPPPFEEYAPQMFEFVTGQTPEQHKDNKLADSVSSIFGLNE